MRKKVKNKYGVLIIVFSFLATGMHGQENSLSKEQFTQIVKSFHPICKQADISIEKANANIQANRGAFDPVFSSGIQQKEVGGKPYYSHGNAEITIPTWYGVDIKAGIENNEGSRIDPEVSLGQTNLVGVKFSLNSLLYDKRRAALQQASLLRSQSETEKKLIVNNLLFDALSTYWSWVKEYETLQIISTQLNKTYQRVLLVKGEVEQGARPAIDTVEAFAQYYTLRQQQNNAEQAWYTASVELSAYLWVENNTPYTLPSDVIPVKSALNETTEALPTLANAHDVLVLHPKIKMIDTKLDILQIDKRLKTQNLIPKLSVNAAMVNNSLSSQNWFNQKPGDNYKFSIDLNVPILMRTARADIKTANLKINEVQIEKSYTLNQLDVKVKSYYNEYISLQAQIRDYENVRSAYNTLFNGEVLKFQSGESTLFLVNTRELKLLEASQKLIELQAKQQKAFAGVLFAAGLLL
jgi:outer membrane protein TolC